MLSVRVIIRCRRRPGQLTKLTRLVPDALLRTQVSQTVRDKLLTSVFSPPQRIIFLRFHSNPGKSQTLRAFEVLRYFVRMVAHSLFGTNLYVVL